MMVITLDSADSRTLKAVALAADAGQWARIHTRDGRKAYGVQSSKDINHYYIVTCETCTCADFKQRQKACKHVLAVRLHCTLVKAVQTTPQITAADVDRLFARFEGD